jgi:hypothetical protein
MSAPALNPPKPRSRLGRLVTLPRLATAVTWVFWLAVLITAVQVLEALTRAGNLFDSVPNSLPGFGIGPLSTRTGPEPLVWAYIAPPLLQHAGSTLIHSGLAPGVQAAWNGAVLGTAHPTAGQGLAFALTLLPPGLLRVGTLYLVMRLARTAARDGVYTAQAARLVLCLGWWLLAGGLVATVAEAFAQLNLVGLLVTWPVDWVHWPQSWGWSWPVEWFGLGLIIFARVMRVSAGMRADLEGTV